MNHQKVTRALDMNYVLRESAWSLILILEYIHFNFDFAFVDNFCINFKTK